MRDYAGFNTQDQWKPLKITKGLVLSEKITQQLSVDEALSGLRLDQALAKLLPEHSRSKLTQWIKEGKVTVDDQPAKAKQKVLGGEEITVEVEEEAETNWQAEAVPLNIVFEDEEIIVINKPAGLVVHPGAGNSSGTLVNGLLHHCPELQNVPRAGLIHRLDKDTTGLLVIAKTALAHTHLTQLLQERNIKREYLALVKGVLTGGGTIDEPIGRHPRSRLKMAVVETGRLAVTHFRLQEKFNHYTLLKVMLETGRTHQIRVHFSHHNHPVVGDQLYSRLQLAKGCSEKLADSLRSFKRQALHARHLSFEHPVSGEVVSFEAPLPEDFQQLLTVMREENPYENDWLD